MNKITDFILPGLVVLIIIHGAFKGINVFDEFIKGAKSGFNTILDITPSLIALLLCVNMLRASGGLDVVCSLVSPITSLLGIPKEITPLAILSPISGSGALGMYENILKSFGPDSYIGKCASVIMGSTETTFYAITLYYGSINIKKTRHTLPSALCADLTSFILSPRLVKLFLIKH